MSDYDKFGHCILCDKNMVIEEVIDHKPQIRFTAEYDETQVLLDDGSRMRVVTCRDCKFGFSDKDFTKAMNKVIKGWERELEKLPWDDKRKENYMKRYSKLKIVTKADNVPEETLKEKLKEFKEKK